MVNNIYNIFIIYHKQYQTVFSSQFPSLDQFMSFIFNISKFFHRYGIFHLNIMNKCNCSIAQLSQLLVCTEATCIQPSIRCKNCYKFFHRYQDEGKQKKNHPSQTFDKSALFKNFMYLIKTIEIIQSKVMKSFDGLALNVNQLADLVFSSSEVMQSQIFRNNQGYCYNQFHALKELYYGRPYQFAMSPTPEFILALSRFSAKKFDEVRRTLIKKTPEQQLLQYNFNMITDNTTNEVQKFIESEQNAFYQYCEKLKNQQAKGFDVYQYLKERRSQKDKNQNYYCRSFENFLEQKYSISPQKQQLFTLAEYSRYIWTQFYIISTLTHEEQYLNYWITAYEAYSKYYQEEKFEESVLSFRMWKQYAAKYENMSNIKNAYFLDNFIISYIDLKIQRKTYGSEYEEYTLGTWQDYKKYLKDFVKVVQNKKEEYVVMPEYKKYYIFRSENEKFIEHLKHSKDVVYSSLVATNFLNEIFIKNGKVSLKSYKAFLLKYEEEEKAKQQQQQKKIKQLQKELLDELGADNFYETIFEGFINSALTQKAELTKQNYYFYRNQVLDKFDQNQIRLENQELAYDRKLLEEQENAIQQTADDKQKNIKYKIEVDEEIIHQLNQNEESDDDEFLVNPKQCPCCKGDPENCPQEQCQMMGICVTCCL